MTGPSVARLALVAGIMGLLAACVAAPVGPVPQTAAYAKGHKDGCESGWRESGIGVRSIKDPEGLDPAEYGLGWEHGYRWCFSPALLYDRNSKQRERDST